MASSQEPPLDEIQWRSPPIAQSMGGIHTNTVLPYFSHSPFFDGTSNNAALTTQATYNPNMLYLIQTREAFEGRLKTMAGLEFMVSHDPSNDGQQQDNSGVWVIRKQNRRKRGGYEDEVTVLSSYFVVGENIYMAPSVGNVLGSRMLSIVTSLTKLLSTASALPIFTPSLGHIYIPPAPKSTTSAPSTQPTQRSIESTPLPDSQPSLKSTKAPLTTAPTTFISLQETRLLADSFNLYLRYSNEYMDENPLVGEPGSFILSRATTQQPETNPPGSSQPKSALASTTTSRPPTPKIDTAVAGKVGKGGGGEKSPTTPGVKGKKERRKSKGVLATGVTTPK
ncbi:MAG: mediator of RNA polymerase II transcription subunit 6 [Lasallia pustulata]|uniref:Mediator of RNA polymerase II transcription subunit 6 n=1 Tax=Lasallia pustulata TaxID=136370 RepID=A0A5M8PJG7_9LECA|nr:MAG: mediator of RNA polymerase II transcription subunit 6 [Lasallia pustulata]